MDPLLMRSLAPLMRRSSPRMLFQHTVSPHKSIQTRAISKLLGIGREDRRSQSVAKARTAKIRQSKPTPRQIILGQTEGRSKLPAPSYTLMHTATYCLTHLRTTNTGLSASSESDQENLPRPYCCSHSYSTPDSRPYRCANEAIRQA